jgi:hypothetical protein
VCILKHYIKCGRLTAKSFAFNQCGFTVFLYILNPKWLDDLLCPTEGSESDIVPTQNLDLKNPSLIFPLLSVEKMLSHDETQAQTRQLNFLLSKNMTLFPQWTTQPTTTYME